MAVLRDYTDHGRLEFPIGKVLYQTARGKLGGPSFSPDGKSIAAFEDTDDGEVIILVDLAGKKRTLSSGWAKKPNTPTRYERLTSTTPRLASFAPSCTG